MKESHRLSSKASRAFSKPTQPLNAFVENHQCASTKDQSQLFTTPLKLATTSGEKRNTEAPRGTQGGQKITGLFSQREHDSQPKIKDTKKSILYTPLPSTANFVDLTTPPSKDDLVALPHQLVTRQKSEKQPPKKMSAANVKDVEVENALYFMKGVGKDMPETRVEVIKNKLRQASKDVKIHSRFCKSKLPRFLVLDFDVNLTLISEVLGFASTLEMASLLLGKVHFVSPAWVLSHADSIMNPDTKPSDNEIWSGQFTLQRMKKRARENNNSSKGLKKQHKPNDLATLVRTPTSRTSDEIITKKQDKSGARAEATVVQQSNNVKFANMLNVISKLYKEAPTLPGDKWRCYSYNIASGRVRTLDFEVSLRTLDKLKKIKGVGDKVLAHAREFLETGDIALIKEFEKDELRLSMRAMTKIWGVGPKLANDMIGYGLRNICDVRKALENGQLHLTDGQKVGVEFYEEFQKKMTIDEVQRIAKTVKDMARKFYPDIELEIMGSYRRGKTQCGDIDLLLIHKEYNDTIPKGFLDMLVERLRLKGHISHHLTKVDTKHYHTQSQGFHPKMFLQDPNSEIYMGVFNSPHVAGMHRRIDIKFQPYKEKIFALISFTGNGFFNRAIRLHATRKKGWKLSEKGLFDGTGRSIRKFSISSELCGSSPLSEMDSMHVSKRRQMNHLMLFQKKMSSPLQDWTPRN
ncbi:hypothetical protein CTEN210_09551 [Chaetoceros tenuissimus]|uniref:DNA polymerase n=1 Tax=Chaetoceros tenuissimus TaxID=426638 RepID=A0AAD3H7B7_9STRA|nr:hypothetical protein CTEN210_09551 [Chaetoceros tenuissimus]